MALAGGDLYPQFRRHILTDSQLRSSGYPRSATAAGDDRAVFASRERNACPENSNVRICHRCLGSSGSDGSFNQPELCSYHWGSKTNRKVYHGSRYDWVGNYACCNKDDGARGCVTVQHHVHRENKYKDLTGYVKTTTCSTDPTDGNFGMYCIDCEMIYTTAGLELARVTVVDHNKKQVYDKLVKPDHPVTDYNTRFSGITESDLEPITTTIRDVQKDLLELFNDKTILIGHALESDLIALKLIHDTVVDTIYAYPHAKGPPYKMSLKQLVSDHLHREIQTNSRGHSSMEDAVACMDLMLRKIRR